MVDEGKSVPALDQKPELREDLYLVWKGFNDLHRSRSIGFAGPNPLAITDILAWFQLHQFEASTCHEFFELILALDDEWLSWMRKKQKEESDNR